METITEKINIAIDGPSGAGKSTLARALADRLGITYIDTGAMYRTIALGVMRMGTDIYDSGAVISALPSLGLTVSHGREQRVFLGGEDVTALIRTDEVSKAASVVSVIPEVRAFLLSLQRDIAEKQSVVMDGRDIGTVILPNADVKIFMTASPEKRAERRYGELIARGESVTYDDVLRSQRERDEKDRQRDIAPAVPAADAVMFDNTGLGIAEMVDAAVKIIKDRIGK